MEEEGNHYVSYATEVWNLRTTKKYFEYFM